MSAQTAEAFLALERQLAARSGELEQERAHSATVSAEAVAYRAAVGDIFRAMAGSPADARPVFAMLVERAMALSGARVALVARFDGELVHPVARSGMSAEEEAQFQALPHSRSHRPDRSTAQGRAILDRRVTQIADLEREGTAYDGPLQSMWTGRLRSVVAVPLMHGSACIGSFSCGFAAAGVVSERTVSLLQTFADQAVIAIENARLFRETQEALERQSATVDVLKAIGSSMDDAAPVFDKILESGRQLFDAGQISLFLLDDAGNVTLTASSKNAFDEMNELYPRPLNDSINGLPVKALHTIHYASVVAIADKPGDMREVYARVGDHSVMVAPMVWEGAAIGTLLVGRAPPAPFTDKEISLLTTFADQAVIAVQNARLFNKTREALEHQTATAEVLKVISSSVADAQPVFEKILDSCESLFDVEALGIFLVDDDQQLHMAARRGEQMEASAPFYPRPLAQTGTEQAILAQTAIHIPDVAAAGHALPAAWCIMFDRVGNFSALVAPLIRDGRGIGSIGLNRVPPKPFSDNEIALLTTFADQAVIAIENARLFRETQEALERQTAMSDILRVISESPTEVQPVFDVIAERALALCNARIGGVMRFDGEVPRPVAIRGVAPEAFKALSEARLVADLRGSINGRAILARAPVQSADVFSEPGYSVTEAARLGRFRSILSVPLLREGSVIGTIWVAREETGQFPDKLVTLLQTFAAQAVIAIENVRLFNETQQALEQQTAVSDILRVTTESPTDVQPVLDAIADHAVRLCEAASASIFLIEDNHLRHVSSGGAQIDQSTNLELLPIDRTSTSGRAVLERRVVHVTDMQAEAEEFPRGCEYALRMGHRTIVVAPLLREGKPFGTLMLRRMEVRPFSEREIKLLRTFGDQAAIALENVRLFNETQEALKHQTATAEVLKVISSSVADTQPVFEKILDSCQLLFDINEIIIGRVQDGMLTAEAVRGAWAQAAARNLPRPVAETAAAQAFSERRTVHIPDAAAVAATLVPALREICENIGNFTLATAPFLRHGVGVGGIALWRFPPKPFTDKEIALLTTFADQAVIAIENARLFHEIEDKSHQLATANQHKSDFLANMSHELRTPLNAVIGFSEVLLERMFGELNEKQDDYLKDILSSGKHLLSLIGDILDLSKIEAGRMELELEEFDVAAALGNALTLIRERAQQHGIGLSLEVAAEIGALRADQRKIKQIMLNLLSNAVKFTPDGGSISVQARQTDDVLEVAVSDTGIGIAPADQDTVFQEFRQVGGSYSNKQEGTGLGLALTRRFVELHGGSMGLQSAPGQGSTFTFTIPRQLCAAS